MGFREVEASFRVYRGSISLISGFGACRVYSGLSGPRAHVCDRGSFGQGGSGNCMVVQGIDYIMIDDTFVNPIHPFTLKP